MIRKKTNIANDVGSGSQRQPPPDESFKPSEEIGVAGAKISTGYVHDEFLQTLVDRRGRRIYRQMRDNDDIVGSIFFMLEGIIRAVDWRVEFDVGDIEGDEDPDDQSTNPDSSRVITDPDSAVAFLEGVLFEDMTMPWDDFLMNATSMYVFGWQYNEIIWKKRNGQQKDKNYSSQYDDGLFGIQKLADRSQETLYKWDIDQYGTVYGMWQEPPNGGKFRYIPVEKAIHFKTTPNKDNPEGRSMLRNAYQSWYYKKNIMVQEAIGIERELNGLPVVAIPNATLNGTSPAQIAAKNDYESLVRDIKFNSQGGVVIPSDPYYDGEGKPTNIRQVELKLLTAEGTRAIDTDKVMRRYDVAIARSVLMQFLLLSSAGSKGGYGQSRNESDLFFRAVTGMVTNMATTINRQLVTKIWELNGLDSALMPIVVPGKLNPVDIQALGDFVQKLAGAGVSLLDQVTQDYLREAGGLPVGDGGLEDGELDFDEGEEDE